LKAVRCAIDRFRNNQVADSMTVPAETAPKDGMLFALTW
jgi:hypothetical protein